MLNIPADLNPSDVKDFIRFLAVQCSVSASSQNQAFNALLFLYRQVLKTDFEDYGDTIFNYRFCFKNS
ncbi:MAG TPA: phage integrase N-terminal SAM-like domain-containing protein [Candidatus Wujingus californicus]|uniref:phage integrase N-terminal SAM-like domain-containing protein n=1 Tax=Candidatus Wujingus californicus TaxID=3367618 RepID=UPI001DC1BC0E|nr:phage integrase N-terminal SAM-like domain-containing protein [Planctomycetota bacterium]